MSQITVIESVLGFRKTEGSDTAGEEARPGRQHAKIYF